MPPATAYTFDDLRAFHDEFTLRNWIEPGEMMRYAFLNTPEFMPHAIIHRDGPISMLAEAPREGLAGTPIRTPLGTLPLDEYVRRGPVNGVVILHRGSIVYERYPRMHRTDKHLLMSVSKVFAGTLIAILEDRGQIDTRATVETYLPELRGSGWEGVRVRDVLDMASGIDCDELAPEAYHDTDSAYYPFEESLGLIPTFPGSRYSTWEYVATLGRARPPGEAFDYTSVNTFVLSWLAERITNRPFADLVSEEIWSRIGAESDALISSSRCGAVAAHGGMTVRLRDLARFGLLFTPSWQVTADTPIVSERYLKEIIDGGRSEIFDKGVWGRRAIEQLAPARPRHNSYHWDFVMPNDDFYKGGFGGQGLYISPTNDLVIAFVGTMVEAGQANTMMSIAQQLSEKWQG
ncbi:MAG: beta-lactamase family protein [Chloroflexota bacterium]|nr:beta-lactamase family protein [Chloroflexota bacterium]